MAAIIFIKICFLSFVELKPVVMSHEKTIHDGKKKKNPLKRLKERRAERKARRTERKQEVLIESKHKRKPRKKKKSTE